MLTIQAIFKLRKSNFFSIAKLGKQRRQHDVDKYIPPCGSSLRRRQRKLKKMRQMTLLLRRFGEFLSLLLNKMNQLNIGLISRAAGSNTFPSNPFSIEILLCRSKGFLGLSNLTCFFAKTLKIFGARFLKFSNIACKFAI